MERDFSNDEDVENSILEQQKNENDFVQFHFVEELMPMHVNLLHDEFERVEMMMEAHSLPSSISAWLFSLGEKDNHSIVASLVLLLLSSVHWISEKEHLYNIEEVLLLLDRISVSDEHLLMELELFSSSSFEHDCYSDELNVVSEEFVFSSIDCFEYVET